MAEKASFGMILPETLKTGFVESILIYIHVNVDPIHNMFLKGYPGKPGSCGVHIENVKPL